MKKKHRNGNGATSLLISIPLATRGIVEPLIGGHGMTGAWQFMQNNNPAGALRELVDVFSINFLGFKPSTGEFNMGQALETYKLIGIGYIGSKAASKLGVNKHFQKLPFVGKKWKL